MQHHDHSASAKPVVFAVEFESFKKHVTNGLYEGFQFFIFECQELSFGVGV